MEEVKYFLVHTNGGAHGIDWSIDDPQSDNSM